MADHLDYHVVAEAHLAHARLFAPLPDASSRWGPRLGQVRKTLWLDDERWKVPAGSRERGAERGHWGIAVLARVDCRDPGSWTWGSSDGTRRGGR